MIAAGSVAGLVMGLTLHQLGLPFRVYERVARARPLGEEINLRPNLQRELFDPGLKAELDALGVRTRQYGLSRAGCMRVNIGRSTRCIGVTIRLCRTRAARQSRQGRDGLMQMVEGRTGGVFGDIETVIPQRALLPRGKASLS